MGLSATPYEADEERILSRYFGEIIYEFSLHRAIKEGFLCKYNYHPIFIELSTEEVGKYLAINDLIQRKKEYINEEEYESSVEEYTELDRMLVTVVAILSALENIITKEVDKHYSLFYCGTGSVELANGEKVRQINSLSRMLDSLGWKVTKITADEKPAEREAIFASFKRKEVDAIASIRVLDEGIDIPDCRTAYILASQKSERQGIQRRGRILRNSPGKMIANLYDFIITGPKLSNSDLDKLYMRELSRAKLFAKDAVNKELCTFEIEQY
jgi:superfamily II DNA or RNA helicase